jgi:hypothetical protein
MQYRSFKTTDTVFTKTLKSWESRGGLPLHKDSLRELAQTMGKKKKKKKKRVSRQRPVGPRQRSGWRSRERASAATGRGAASAVEPSCGAALRTSAARERPMFGRRSNSSPPILIESFFFFWHFLHYSNPCIFCSNADSALNLERRARPILSASFLFRHLCLPTHLKGAAIFERYRVEKPKVFGLAVLTPANFKLALRIGGIFKIY